MGYIFKYFCCVDFWWFLIINFILFFLILGDIFCCLQNNMKEILMMKKIYNSFFLLCGKILFFMILNCFNYFMEQKNNKSCEIINVVGGRECLFFVFMMSVFSFKYGLIFFERDLSLFFIVLVNGDGVFLFRRFFEYFFEVLEEYK